MHLPRAVWPTIEQMSAILTASPRLHRLRLSDFGIVRHEPYNSPGPILLSELHEINLRNLITGLQYLLPLIQPGPELSQASIMLNGSEGEELAVSRFFHQSSVDTLHIRDFHRAETLRIGELFGNLPGLERLALENASVSFESLQADFAYWPQLATLCMLECLLSSDVVPPAFNLSQNLGSFIMWRCNSGFYEPLWQEREEVGNNEAVMERFARDIANLVPQLKLKWRRHENPVDGWYISR